MRKAILIALNFLRTTSLINIVFPIKVAYPNIRVITKKGKKKRRNAENERRKSTNGPSS